jgi:hypothetical protein
MLWIAVLHASAVHHHRQVDGLVDTSRPIVGMPPGSSLLTLGYNEVGLDSGWAHCEPPPGYQPVNSTSHKPEADGTAPTVINTERFPDMKALVSYAHAKGLRAGWYMNQCLVGCTPMSDSYNGMPAYVGDVNLWADAKFDSVKFDGCSAQHNMSLWAALLNKTGRPAIVENCHVTAVPEKPIDQGGCPDFHLYRTSTDIRNTYGSFMENAQTVAPYAASNRTGPGCWAYPGSLVHTTHTQRVSFGRAFVILVRAESALQFSLQSLPLTISLPINHSSCFSTHTSASVATGTPLDHQPLGSLLLTHVLQLSVC